MIIIQHSASSLKRFIASSNLSDFARLLVTRMALEFILHRGRISCSSAAGMIASQPIHRGQVRSADSFLSDVFDRLRRRKGPLPGDHDQDRDGEQQG
jgi:hypothetical protein